MPSSPCESSTILAAIEDNWRAALMLLAADDLDGSELLAHVEAAELPLRRLQELASEDRRIDIPDRVKDLGRTLSEKLNDEHAQIDRLRQDLNKRRSALRCYKAPETSGRRFSDDA